MKPVNITNIFAPPKGKDYEIHLNNEIVLKQHSFYKICKLRPYKDKLYRLTYRLERLDILNDDGTTCGMDMRLIKDKHEVDFENNKITLKNK